MLPKKAIGTQQNYNAGEKKKRLFMRGSVNYQVKQIWHKIDGIGTSKLESRSNGIQNNYGQKVSEKVHSFRYKDEVIRTAKDLGTFAREKFNVKDMQAISREIVESFIQEKINDNVSYNTISNYISHLQKIQIGLEKIGAKLESHNNLFTRDDLKEIRELTKEQAYKTEHQAREYINPERIIANLDEKYQIVARLQFEYGLRVAEASRINEHQLNGNSLTIQGKGGYTLTKEISKDLVNKINSYIEKEKSFNVSYNSYSNALKKVVQEVGEKYSGTHGFRYNYAQNRMDFYQNQGYSRDEALKMTSENMGHHRAEITEVYLR